MLLWRHPVNIVVQEKGQQVGVQQVNQVVLYVHLVLILLAVRNVKHALQGNILIHMVLVYVTHALQGQEQLTQVLLINQCVL